MSPVVVAADTAEGNAAVVVVVVSAGAGIEAEVVATAAEVGIAVVVAAAVVAADTAAGVVAMAAGIGVVDPHEARLRRTPMKASFGARRGANAAIGAIKKTTDRHRRLACSQGDRSLALARFVADVADR